MTQEEKRRAYEAFFMKTEAGKAFIDQLTLLIANNHEQSEIKPELARDYSQRARGAREVLDHINSVTARRSKAN